MANKAQTKTKMMKNDHIILGSSFRDPSGFMFREKNTLYRQINRSYKENYSLLKNSGLYDELTENGLLIEHIEIETSCGDSECYKHIKPAAVPFISYPYEWTFSQLKDAALATLEIQKIAMKHGMTLKDASAFNIQFIEGKPLLIDTLSFEKYEKKKPWVAYRQFCQHFLAPLALMSCKDIRLIQLFRVFIDGIPLDLASSLLPKSTYANISLFMHIHAHAKTQKRFASKQINRRTSHLSEHAMQGLISSLINAIKKLHWKKTNTEWDKYYSFTNYSDSAFKKKKKIIEEFIDVLPKTPALVWDLGGNTGLFSRIASNKEINTISFDIDYLAVEKNYREMREKKEKHILPLFLDLTNPSTNLGWAHQERESLEKRGPADLIMALALIHHLSISNNVPIGMIASYFSLLCKYLIVEFIPKDDSNVQKLLSTRKDIFIKYNQKNFEKSFNEYFDITSSQNIEGSKRVLYLMISRHIHE
ncbi:MAG: SAM-dependent methyltransferase [Patescibacteria group bacterium]|nr:SAM-dependent methyltransferase [Patescibacteria group bacterium]